MSVFSTSINVPLDRFSLCVDYSAENRVTGVFGVSGSGKTTYVETLAGLRKGATGRISCGNAVWLDSEKGVFVPVQDRCIGYVPQEHLLFPQMNVQRNLSFARGRAERTGADYNKVFSSVVEVLELGPLLERSVTDLSGGERQRVSLGRALCSGPRLLLLDEPTASLDAKLRLKILPFLKRVRDVFDLPIVIVSHNPSELNALCDEIVALRAGKVVASGRPMDVLTRPDLFGDVESQGFRNVLSCVVTAHEKGVTLAGLGQGGEGQKLVIPRCHSGVGETVFVDIAASEILLSRSRPSGLSARNVIPAEIAAIRETGSIVVIEVSVGGRGPEIVAEITPDALAEMALVPGETVHLIMKSSSFGVHSS